MSWEDELSLEGKGSYRGIEFYVGSTEGEIGRRKIVHEFPNRPTPKVQDDGRLPRKMRLTCYVLGTNYHIDRDELRREFEAEGSGKLIHPWWGEFEVEIVSPVRIKETFKEGGMARFDLDVVEVSDEPIIIAEPDLGPEVEIKCDAALVAIGSDFEASFSLVGAIASVITTAVNAVNQLASKIRAARGLINTALNVIDSVGDAITAVADAAASIVLAPALLVAAVQGVIDDVMAAANTITDAFEETAALFGRTSGDYQAQRTIDGFRTLTGDQELDDVVENDSSQTAQEILNQTALENLQKQTAAVETARNLVLIEYSNRTLVIDLRDEVIAVIDTLMLTAGDETWAALADLKDVFNRRMNEIASTLPTLVDIAPKKTIPALVLAYNLYGDSSRATEIINRNAVKDPNFVPGGQDLKVVSE